MADKIIENNQVSMMGKIAAGFTFSHQVFGEGFYMTELLVKRLSDSEDRIPVMVSERLVDVTQDYIGEYVEIHGQFRSYNRHEEKHNRLVLSVFSRELKFVEEEDETVPVNQIFLDGYICKPPVYRKTPLGREIADVLLAVNRPYGKSDYIPCICWGRNARYASAFEVGGHVLIWGRIQSREYMKRIGENETEKRVCDSCISASFLHNRILFQITGNESMGCILHAYNRQTAEIYLHCGNSSADPDHGRNVYTGAFLLPVSLSYGSSICNHADHPGSTFQTKSSKLCAKVHSL